MMGSDDEFSRAVASSPSPVQDDVEGESLSGGVGDLSKQSQSNTAEWLCSGDAPHQPLQFRFPKRLFGKTKPVKRAFQSNWFKQWTWIHYNEEKDLAICFLCAKALREKKLFAPNAEESFTTKGFSNWKDATVRFRDHAKTDCHKDALLKLVVLPKTTPDVGELMSRSHAEDKAANRQCFLKLLSNMRFLARQALPMRGHEEDNSNFIQLYKLRGEDDENVLAWLKKKHYKYTSAQIQNEMLQVMALKVK